MSDHLLQWVPSLTTLEPARIGWAAVAAALLVIFLFRVVKKSPNYPPGPPRDPILGNARQMTEDYIERRFTEWGKRYGDVNYLEVLGQPLVVLNSYTACRDLLEKRSGIYSSRPRLVLLSELMGYGDVLVHQRGGPRFRKHRRIVQDHFSAKSLANYTSLQRKEVYTTLANIGDSPHDFDRHLKRVYGVYNNIPAAGLILNVTYGYNVRDCDDQFIAIADAATRNTVKAGGPGAMLCDMFPILKYLPAWFPFAGFKRHALLTRELVLKMFDAPYQWVKGQIASGTASPCIAVDLLEVLRTQSGPCDASKTIDEQDILHITGVLYAAATDTTGSFLMSFVLCMVLHPDAFRKAQEEIDQVIGNDRLVDFDDRNSLPYFNSILKEVLRWGCPVPLGVPRQLTSDDNYRGYFLPKGSTVFFNAWAITRNEELYPEPEKFDPERFIGKMDSEAASQVDAVFGFGRRVCPGKAFAEANVWLLMANIVATMTIEKRVDETGQPITPNPEYIGSFVRHVKTFPCKMAYRSEKARAAVERTKLLHS